MTHNWLGKSFSDRYWNSGPRSEPPSSWRNSQSISPLCSIICNVFHRQDSVPFPFVRLTQYLPNPEGHDSCGNPNWSRLIHFWSPCGRNIRWLVNCAFGKFSSSIVHQVLKLAIKYAGWKEISTVPSWILQQPACIPPFRYNNSEIRYAGVGSLTHANKNVKL